MKLSILLFGLLSLFMLWGCTTQKKINNLDPTTFEAPFHKVSPNMTEKEVIALCGNPHQKELDKVYQGKKYDYFYYDTKPKKPVFKIIFHDGKVEKILRYDNSMKITKGENGIHKGELN